MAESKKPKFTTITTPTVTFKYPKLNKPDTKFKAEGIYGLKFALEGEAAQNIIEKVDAAAVELFEATKKALLEEGKAKLKDGQVLLLKDGKPQKNKDGSLKTLDFADRSYREVLDEEGEGTGEFEFNIKMNAQYIDKRTQSVKYLRPLIVNAKGESLKNPPQIWGGTEGKVKFQLVPFFTAIGIGVQLRLDAVQIIRLVSEGERDAGFEDASDEEGAYTGTGSESADADDSSSDKASGAAADAEDF